MSLLSTAETLVSLAESGGQHDSLNAYFVGGGALAGLLLLLWLVTRLNRDR